MLSRFQMAVPEHKEWETDPVRLNMFYILGQVWGVTRDIEFHWAFDQDAPPELLDLRDFWTFARECDDLRGVWEAFTQLVTMDVADEWYSVFNQRDKRLLAPPELNGVHAGTTDPN